VAGNGNRLRDAVAESLMVEPALAQAEVDLHSSAADGKNAQLRMRMKELLLDAPNSPAMDAFAAPDLDPGVLDSLRSALEESLGSSATLADAELHALQDLGLEKLGEFRSAIRGHLSGEAELADRDLAIYVKAGEGRKSAFQRALEENLKDLGERPPFERTSSEEGKGDALSLPVSSETTQDADVFGQHEPAESSEGLDSESAQPEADEPLVKSVTLSSGPTVSSDREARAETGSDAGVARVPRMEPIPLLTAALEAVGFAEDEFGFVLRYGRYAQPGRSSEFLVGGVGLSDLSDRLAGWLEAQGATDCEVQVLDDGSGELMIYLLGHDQPLASPGLDYGSG
jgi:hypothetical protein